MSKTWSNEANITKLVHFWTYFYSPITQNKKQEMVPNIAIPSQFLVFFLHFTWYENFGQGQNRFNALPQQKICDVRDMFGYDVLDIRCYMVNYHVMNGMQFIYLEGHIKLEFY